ncbi:hypothetical protein GCM10022207_89630 [Streptomyces lannensis]|uniref:Uncharacterized protein n=1 Tax=Streptomyces lannensis TaxID=766498 RepID=A0ABP7LU53_9ACTN
MPFEAVDTAFDRVPLTVVDRVELRRPTATGAAFLAVVGLVNLVRDGAEDAASSQVGAVLARGVRLVRADPPRPGAGPARPQARNPDTVQDGLELRGVTSLAPR